MENLKADVTKHTKLPKNEPFLPPDMHTRAYQGVRKIRFSENLAYIIFL